MPSLTEARAQAGLSRRGLARRAGVSVSTIYPVECGRTTPQPHIVRRLSRALELESDQITEFAAGAWTGGTGRAGFPLRRYPRRPVPVRSELVPLQGLGDDGCAPIVRQDGATWGRQRNRVDMPRSVVPGTRGRS